MPSIDRYYQEERLTRQMSLTNEQRQNLESDDIYDLINRNIITIEEVLALNNAVKGWHENLKVDFFQELLTWKSIKLKDLSKFVLPPKWHQVLHGNSSDSSFYKQVIGDIIRDRLMSLKKALSFKKKENYQKLSSRFIRKLIVSKSIINGQPFSLDCAFNLTPEQYGILNSEDIFGYIEYKRMTLDQALSLTPEQVQILKSKDIYWDIVGYDGEMTLEQALRLTLEQVQILNSENISRYRHLSHYFDNMTVDQALNLTLEQVQILNSDRIFHYINHGLMKLDQALNLTPEQVQILNSDRIFRYIDQNIMRVDHALNLTLEQANTLNLDDIDPAIPRILGPGKLYDYILSGFIGPEQTGSLDIEVALLLRPNKITDKLIQSKLITFAEVIELSESGFGLDWVLKLISDKKITVKQVMNLSVDQRIVLCFIKDKLKSSDLTIDTMLRWKLPEFDEWANSFLSALDTLKEKIHENKELESLVQHLIYNVESFRETKIDLMTFRGLALSSIKKLRELQNIEEQSFQMRACNALIFLIRSFCRALDYMQAFVTGSGLLRDKKDRPSLFKYKESRFSQLEMEFKKAEEMIRELEPNNVQAPQTLTPGTGS